MTRVPYYISFPKGLEGLDIWQDPDYHGAGIFVDYDKGLSCLHIETPATSGPIFKTFQVLKEIDCSLYSSINFAAKVVIGDQHGGPYGAHMFLAAQASWSVDFAWYVTTDWQNYSADITLEHGLKNIQMYVNSKWEGSKLLIKSSVPAETLPPYVKQLAQFRIGTVG